MKRFTDTDIWDKEWFMALKPRLKCLVQFIFTKCDHSGVWSPNWILASSFIGEKVSIYDLSGLKRHFEILPNGKVFVIDFVKFQYGELTESCMPHRKVITLLKTHGLFERVMKVYQYPIDTVEDKEADKDKEVEVEVGKDEERPKSDVQKIVMPFQSDPFLLAWNQWKDYKKKEHRFGYKSLESQQAALLELANLSGGHESVALEIIQRSIAKGWKGFFKLDKNGQPTSNNSKQPTGGNVDTASAFAKIDSMYGSINRDG